MVLRRFHDSFLCIIQRTTRGGNVIIMLIGDLFRSAWCGLVYLSEPVLKSGVTELIHWADRSHNLTLASIVKKPQ